MTDAGFIRRFMDVTTSGPLESWLDMITDDVVMRFPYAPPGVNPELRGVDAVTAVFKQVWASFSHFEWYDVDIRKVEGDDLYITTARSRAQRSSGEAYGNEYVLITRITGSKVSEHVEYFDPQTLG